MKELPHLLDILLEGKNITQKDAKDFLNTVLKGGVDPILIAGITTALRAKCAGEVSGAVV